METTIETLPVPVIDVSKFEAMMPINSKAKKHAKLGLLLKEPDTEELEKFREIMSSCLEEIVGEEPLHFEDTHILRGGYNTGSFTFNNRDSDAWLKGRVCPTETRYVCGVTRLHDDVHVLWDRRYLRDYIANSNSLPQRITELIESLQYRIPIGVSLTVWTPAPFANRQVEIDPMLVLEISDHLCFGLMRWNPTL